MVQDLDKIDNVVFGEHKGAISVNSNNNNFNKIVITIDDHDEDVITAHVMINGSVKGIITSWVYKDLLEFIESYLNGTNELDAIGEELVGYLKIDDYEINDSTIKITLPNNREMKIMHERENVYNIAYKAKVKIYGKSEVVDETYRWDYERIETDSVKNLAKIIVLRYIYNF